MVQKLILTVCVLAYSYTFAEGFLAGTVVLTPYGYKNIENLDVGDRVVCYDFKGKCTERSITYTRKEHVKSYIQITVNSEKIYVTSNQKFFLPNSGRWIKSSNIKPRDNYLLQHCTELVQIEDVQEIHEEVDVYDITVDEYHNFLVSHENICVHNFLPLVFGLTIFFDGTVAITAGFAALGAAIGGILWSNHKEHQERDRFFAQAAALKYGSNKPKRPCDKFNPTDTDCYYVDAGYHHFNSAGRKSRAPKDGQTALRNSIRIVDDPESNSARRLGISQDEFVVLSYTCHDSNGNCQFHGHVTEWDKISKKNQKALENRGWVTSRGKIIKK